MSNSIPSNRIRKGRILIILFAVAIVMGPGPGILLINPDPADAEAGLLFLGMPVVYVWASFWFAVEALAVLLAYLTLWRKTDS